MLCKKVLHVRIVLRQKTWNYRVLFHKKIITRQYPDCLKPRYYMAIVMDDFFKVRVDSYGLQNSIIKDLKTLKWLMSCSGMFSLHIGKKPKKGEQSRDGRQTVNQMTGIRDDYLSSEDEED